jgi:hypothetical protein
VKGGRGACLEEATEELEGGPVWRVDVNRVEGALFGGRMCGRGRAEKWKGGLFGGSQ